MRHFDHDYVNHAMSRLKLIPPDAKPAWGKMNRDQLYGHLIMVMRRCMGRGPDVPDKSTWLTRNVLGPLIINGFVKIPKNVRIPRPKGQTAPIEHSGDLETLHAVFEEYLSAVETGKLDPPHHPFFGRIGVDGWSKFHVQHIGHHLRQFGV
jgi:hypothetical protein